MSTFFLSDGFVFCHHSALGEEAYLTPSLLVDFTKFHGEVSSPTGSLLIATYKAKLYSRIDFPLEEEVARNRIKVEELISPSLEAQLLSHLLLSKSATRFQFHNTVQVDKASIPESAVPLLVAQFPQASHLFGFQKKLLRESISENGDFDDISQVEFALVNSKGGGATIDGIYYSEELLTSVFESISGKQTHDPNGLQPKMIKSLAFLKRASVLEELAFYNESFLNYFRVIEAYSGNYHEKAIVAFLTSNFSISTDDSKLLYDTRASVAAHGNSSILKLHEVGQSAFDKCKQIAFSLVRDSFRQDIGKLVPKAYFDPAL